MGLGVLSYVKGLLRASDKLVELELVIQKCCVILIGLWAIWFSRAS